MHGTEHCRCSCGRIINFIIYFVRPNAIRWIHGKVAALNENQYVFNLHCQAVPVYFFWVFLLRFQNSQPTMLIMRHK